MEHNSTNSAHGIVPIDNHSGIICVQSEISLSDLDSGGDCILSQAITDSPAHTSTIFDNVISNSRGDDNFDDCLLNITQLLRETAHSSSREGSPFSKDRLFLNINERGYDLGSDSQCDGLLLSARDGALDGSNDPMMSIGLEPDNLGVNENSESEISQLTQSTDEVYQEAFQMDGDGHNGRTLVRAPSTGSGSSSGRVSGSGVPCPVCNKLFNNSSALAKHKLTHSDERKYACSVCLKTFKRQDHLNGHMLTHSSKKPFVCPIDGCDKSYCDARSLRRHQEFHQEQQASKERAQQQLQQQQYQENIREYRQQLQQQQRQQKQLQQQASSNPASSASPRGASASILPSIDEPPQFRCGLCHRNFKNLPALNGHMRTHGGYIGKKDTTAPLSNEENSSESLRTGNHLHNMPTMSLSSLTTSADSTTSTQLAHRSIAQLLSGTSQALPNSDPATQFLQFFRSIASPMADSQVAASTVSTSVPSADQQDLLSDSSHLLNSTLGISGDIGNTEEESSSDRMTQYIQIGNNLIRVEDLRLLDGSLFDSSGLSMASSDTTHSGGLGLDSGLTVTSSDELDLCLEANQLELLREQQQQLLRLQHVDGSGTAASMSVSGRESGLQQTNQFHSSTFDAQQSSFQGHQELGLSGSLKSIALASSLSNSQNQQLLGLQQSQLLQHLNPSMQQLEQLVSSAGQHPALPAYLNPDAITEQLLRQQHQQQQQEQLKQQLQTQQAQQKQQQQLQTQQMQQKQQLQAQQMQQVQQAQQKQQLKAQQAKQLQQVQQRQQLQEQQRQRQQQHENDERNCSTDITDNAQSYPAASTLQNLLLQWRGNSQATSQGITAPVHSVTDSSFALGSGISTSGATLREGTEWFRPTQTGLIPKVEVKPDISTKLAPDLFGRMNASRYIANIESSAVTEAQSSFPPLLDIVKSTDCNRTIEDFDELQRKRPANANEEFIDDVPRKRLLTMPPFSGSTVLYNLLQQQQPKLTANLTRTLETTSTTVAASEVKYSDVINTWSQGSNDTKPYVADWNNSNKIQTDVKPSLSNIQSSARRSSFSARDLRVKAERPTLLDKTRDLSYVLDDINLFTEDSAAETPDSEHEEPYAGTSAATATSDEFRHPRVGPGFLKFKRKNRPEPLIIPAPQRFQSQLRSPRAIDRLARPTFTPYTPPPMLSPVRSGSGLWCNTFAGSSTPKSAPVSMRLNQLRRNSGVLAAETIPEEEEEEEEEKVTPEVVEKPPETDIAPHINIGPQYQAELPEFTANSYEALKVPSPEDLLWDPECTSKLTNEDLQSYLDFACSACVLYNGGNKEYAMHILSACRGNVKKAVLKLMLQQPQFPAGNPLHSYIYQECDVWSSSEIEAFQSALNKHGKDFFSIAEQIGSKSSRECVQQYYIWKKVCADEHKRQRILRRKREQESLYNLRSSKAVQEDTVIKQEGPFARYEQTAGAEHINVAQESEDTGDTIEFSSAAVHNAPVVKEEAVATVADLGASKLASIEFYIDSVDSPQNFDHYATDLQYEVVVRTEEFPCKICGKVFTKVKSRSAHMKSHRQMDGDSNRSNTR